MKLKKFKSKRILKLHLINSRAYKYATKQATLNALTDFDLTQGIGKLKQMLLIIFQYHQAGKQILFIGLPQKLETKINKLTNHVAVPGTFDTQGIISNTFQPRKQLEKSTLKFHSKLLFPKLSKKSDLVVLFTHRKSQMVVAETKVAKVPLINFTSTVTSINNSYSLQGLEKGLISSNKNLLYAGLNFLFKTIAFKQNRRQFSNHQPSRSKNIYK